MGYIVSEVTYDECSRRRNDGATTALCVLSG